MLNYLLKLFCSSNLILTKNLEVGVANPDINGDKKRIVVLHNRNQFKQTSITKTMEKYQSYCEGNSYIIIHNKNEDNYSKKSFYLRTGKTIGDIMQTAKIEFEKKVNFAFNTGKFSIEKDKIEITPKYSPTLTYLITEGLFYNWKQKKIKTMRTPTKKLYYTNTGFITNIEEINKDLTKLLTDSEKPCIIKIAGANPHDDFLEDIEYNKLSQGFLKCRYVAMNYGYIFGKNSTFIVDGKETDKESQWYILPNESSVIERSKQRFNQNAEIGKISKSNNFHFREADKISPTQRYIFDGKIRDLIKILTENEIKLEKGLSLSNFSNK